MPVVDVPVRRTASAAEPGRRLLRLVTGAEPASADELMTRVAGGDLTAFEALYADLSAAVHGVAVRVLRDPVRAEDVTQEVFLEVWRQAPRFDQRKGRARSWVLTIAHRRAVDAVRSAESARAREERVAREDQTAVEGPESYAVAAAERGSVRNCLDALTPLQRESVTLAYYEGYTYTQVAAVLSRPLPTIKTRMRDGLIRLRDCLEAADVVDA